MRVGTRAEGCRNWKRINEGADTSVESKYYVRLGSYTCSFLLAGVRVTDGAVVAPFERRGKSMMFFRPVPRIVASFFLLFLSPTFERHMEAERRVRDETSGRGETLQAPPWRPMRFGNKRKLRLMKFLGKFTVRRSRIREMIHLFRDI